MSIVTHRGAAVRAARGLAMLGALTCTAVLLSGCASTPVVVPTSAPTSQEPVFASDEEALAAATEAYAAYLTMSDRIANEGGVEPGRISRLVSTSMLQTELDGFAEFVNRGARTVGSTEFTVFDVQSAAYSSVEATAIMLYVCEDVSGIEILDSSGASLVSPGRIPVTPFAASLALGSQGVLVVENRVVWVGENFC